MNLTNQCVTNFKLKFFCCLTEPSPTWKTLLSWTCTNITSKYPIKTLMQGVITWRLEWKYGHSDMITTPVVLNISEILNLHCMKNLREQKLSSRICWASVIYEKSTDYFSYSAEDDIFQLLHFADPSLSVKERVPLLGSQRVWSLHCRSWR